MRWLSDSNRRPGTDGVNLQISVIELRPMMAVSADDPFDDPGWGFEPKWDGVRAIIHVTDQGVTLVSRNGNDVTAAYPEAQVLAGVVPAGTVLDGEVVAFEEGRPSFGRLQSRMHVRDPRRVRQLTVSVPVVVMLFDFLVAANTPVLGESLVERRSRLESVTVDDPSIQISPQVIGEGTALFDAAKSQRLEGIVAKRLDSPYVPGKRSPLWRKIKVVHEVDAVVVGWRPGSGGRSGSIGSLVVALFDPQAHLRYVGSVGSGFDQRSLSAMKEILAHYAVDEPSLDPTQVADSSSVNWVNPELVAVVEYREVTGAGHLRAPVFKGMRSDKSPIECTLDQLQ